MKKRLTGVVAGWTLFYGGLVPSVGAAEPRLIVQVNNLAGFEQTTVAKAEKIVTGIFHELGVQLLWQSARDPETVQAGSGSSSGHYALRINLVASRPTAMGLHKDAAGLAGPPGNGQPGVVAWVFQPTLEKLIERTPRLTQQWGRRLALNVLLGHVIAHEMGHLLLGSAEHSGSGIMTQRWDLDKVRLACTGSLRFSPQQSGKIRATVQAMNSVDCVSASRPPS